MGRIRILEIVSGFAVEGPLGGIERFGIELTRNMDRTCLEPILCGLWRYHTPYEEQWVARLQEEGIEAFFAADWEEVRPYRSFLRAWRGILRHLIGQKVHLIHSHCQFGDVAALLVACPLQARALLRTVHNEREWPKRPWRRRLLTNTLYPLLFHREIGVSQKVADNLKHRPMARLRGQESLCIHNAIDLERFRISGAQDMRKRKRQELGLPANEPTAITIGRLAPQKGHSVLLQAATLVLTEMPSVHFLIVGGGELEEELKSQAKQLGVEHEVLFTGPRQDVEGLLAAVDLFVSSSLWEGLPTAILESMAAKVPVVATDVSGTREIVRDGVTGLLVPPEDPHSLAHAVVRMFREREQAIAMAEQAYCRAQDFSIARVSRQYMEVYHGLLNARDPESPE